MKRSRKTQWKTVGVLALALVSIYVYTLFSSTRALRSLIAEMPEPDAVVFHETMAGARDSEGVAGGQRPISDEVNEGLARVAAYREFFAHLRNAPAMEAIFDAQRLLRDRPYDELAPEAKEGIRIAVDALQSEVAELRRLVGGGGPAAVSSDLRRMDTRVDDHAGDIKTCAMLLRVDLIARLDAGDSAAAREDFMALLDLADILAQEPHLFAHLDRFRMVQGLSDMLQRHCSLECFNREDLSIMAEALEGSAHREDLAVMLQGERLRGVYGLKYIVESSWRARAELLDRAFSRERDYVWTAAYLYLSPLMRPRHNREMIAHARLLGLASEACALPFYEARSRWVEIKIGYDRAPMGLLRFSYAPRIILIGGQQAGYEADLDLMRLGFCLEVYRREHGVYPESLEALSTPPGVEVPLDPFSGEPYRYVREADGTGVLYSVNWNERDDGGNAADGLDAVWQLR